MDDLYYLMYRDRYYKQAHNIKVLMRKLQTTDKISDIYNLNAELNSAVAKLARIKHDDLTAYEQHMTKMMDDICKYGGVTDNVKTEKIKELIDASEMSLEEILVGSAPSLICCNTCPIRTFCDQHPYNEVTELGCSDVWKLYLKGE